MSENIVDKRARDGMYEPPAHLLLVRLPSDKIRIGDVVVTRWGLHEVLKTSRDGKHVLLEMRDEISSSLPEYQHQVLVK